MEKKVNMSGTGMSDVPVRLARGVRQADEQSAYHIEYLNKDKNRLWKNLMSLRQPIPTE